MMVGNFQFHILGAGRGGTSLLAGLLDCHSQLEVGFEVGSVEYLMGKDLFEPDHELVKERVSAYIECCNKKALVRPSILWGNKITTEQIYGLENPNLENSNDPVNILDEFFNEALARTKVIFILRDGRTCINSKVKRTGQSIELASQRWRYSVECYKFFQTRHSHNICIRFEDLLSQPREILTQLCNFLDVSFEEEMMKGTANEKMLMEYRSTGIDISKMNAVELPEAIMNNIAEDMKYCGYL